MNEPSRLWQHMDETHNLALTISEENVSAMMVLLKLSRTRGGYKRDNSVDGVAYLLLADMFGRYRGK
jgi:hypothetical protein